jgi:hypothetical protein
MKLLYATVLAVTLLFVGTASAQVSQGDKFLAQSAIMSSALSARRIATLNGVPSVGVVYLPNRIVRSGEDYIQWRLSAEKNSVGVAKLQRALRSNPITRAELKSRNIPISHVVGVKISSRGDLRLFLLRR